MLPATTAPVTAPEIPVAVARTPDEAAPICGTVHGDPGAAKLTVHVDVSFEGVAEVA